VAVDQWYQGLLEQACTHLPPHITPELLHRVSCRVYARANDHTFSFDLKHKSDHTLSFDLKHEHYSKHLPGIARLVSDHHGAAKGCQDNVTRPVETIMTYVTHPKIPDLGPPALPPEVGEGLTSVVEESEVTEDDMSDIASAADIESPRFRGFAKREG
jgi:hypothetical protein